MKIGEIIEFEGNKYIAQEEVLGCRYCHFDNQTEIDCYKEYGCKAQDAIIFVKIPIELLEKIEQLENQIEMMKNCENCGNAVWESNWMYSKHHCEQDNCNNYNKWEMKKLQHLKTLADCLVNSIYTCKMMAHTTTDTQMNK